MATTKKPPLSHKARNVQRLLRQGWRLVTYTDPLRQTTRLERGPDDKPMAVHWSTLEMLKTHGYIELKLTEELPMRVRTYGLKGET